MKRIQNTGPHRLTYKLRYLLLSQVRASDGWRWYIDHDKEYELEYEIMYKLHELSLRIGIRMVTLTGREII
jgi:hypothetical protein